MPSPVLPAVAEQRGGLHAWTWAALAVCAVGLCLRALNAHADLGSPWVDENDVVDQAVAFMGGEWRYYLLEYGPLPMYLLAGAYRLLALAHGSTALEYASRVFFDGAEQYYVARLLCAVCLGTVALICYWFVAPRFGRPAGFVGAALLGLPGVDVLTDSTVRIDVMQGAFQLCAVIALASALDGRARRYWLAAGACAGFAIASKPLPGLLVLPCFPAASWFAADTPGSAFGGVRALAARLWRTCKNPWLWLSAVPLLAAAALGNPTSLDIRTFYEGQLRAIEKYSGPDAPGSHLDVLQALQPLQTPFLIAAALSILLMLFVEDKRARLSALFPLVYALAFWDRPMRYYYLIAPAMSLCLVMAIAIGLLGSGRFWSPASENGRMPSSPRARLAGWLLVLLPVVLVLMGPASSLEQLREVVSPSTEARQWISQNIASGTRMFHFGSFINGPRLVAMQSKLQRSWADYFDYARDRYGFFERAFQTAYARRAAQGLPSYDLEVWSERPTPLKVGQQPRWLTHSLVDRARRQGQDYIILAGVRSSNVLDLGYPWFAQAELLEHFGNIAIFRVPKPPPPAPSAAD